MRYASLLCRLSSRSNEVERWWGGWLRRETTSHPTCHLHERQAMSHGTPGENVDPDLTPMLDVVMQLLMYFIMCVNFLADEMTEDIKLPAGATARPIYKGEGDILLLGILPDGKVKVFGKEPMDLPNAKQWLRNRYLEIESKSPDKQVRTAIVLRAHLDTNYETVYQVLSMCKAEGFRRFKLRAEIRETS